MQSCLLKWFQCLCCILPTVTMDCKSPHSLCGAFMNLWWLKQEDGFHFCSFILLSFSTVSHFFSTKSDTVFSRMGERVLFFFFEKLSFACQANPAWIYSRLEFPPQTWKGHCLAMRRWGWELVLQDQEAEWLSQLRVADFCTALWDFSLPQISILFCFVCLKLASATLSSKKTVVPTTHHLCTLGRICNLAPLLSPQL